MAPEARSDSDPVVATIGAKNYLARVRVLARSLAAHHPQLRLQLLLTDEVEGLFEPAAEPFAVIRLAELLTEDHRRRLAFAYGRKALAAASKPLLLRELLNRGHPRIVFVDADTLVTAPLHGLFDALDAHSVLLCPHRLRPPAGADAAAVDLGLLRSGTFNAGLIGVRESPTARSFLDWWWDRLGRHCRHAPELGLHLDQRWLDLAPGLFEGVGLLRDSSLNLAWWNFDERWPEGSAAAAAGAPEGCSLFHASGWDPEQPERVSAHAPHLRMPDIGPAAALFEHYGALLGEAGQREVAGWPYAYGSFDDGTPIPDVAREVYLGLGDAVAAFGDPFATLPASSFFHWLRSPATAAGPGEPPISNLWYEIYTRRPDVRRAYPDLGGRNRGRFLEWTARSGLAEHGIPAVFRPPGG